MNIGLYVQYSEKKFSGISRAAAGLIEGLKKINIEDTFFYLGREPYLPQIDGYYELPSNRWELNHLDFCLAEKSIDIVHSFHNAFLCKRKGIRKILTIHDMVHVTHPEWFFRSTNDYYSNYVRKAAQNSDKILADSKYTKSDIVNYFGIEEDKIEVIYNGLYPGKLYETKGIRPYKIELYEGEYLLSVSNIHEYKNQVGLINAYLELRRRHPSCRLKLVIVGKLLKNIDMPDMEDFIRQDIIFTGYVGDEELIWLYRNAYAFLYVSKYEGFGLPILEALYLNKAVICSDCTSMPEVGGDAVEYVNPYEIESILTGMEHVVFDTTRRAELEKKAKPQAELFSYEESAKKVIKIYRELVK